MRGLSMARGGWPDSQPVNVAQAIVVDGKKRENPRAGLLPFGQNPVDAVERRLEDDLEMTQPRGPVVKEGRAICS